MNGNHWIKCEQIARKLDANGREAILRCDLDKHEVPGDSGVIHHDPDYGDGVWWCFDDEEMEVRGDRDDGRDGY